MCPPCFPPTIRDSAPPSLHRVPAGLVPRLRRYYEVLRLPTARPANLRYPSAGGDLPCACVRSTRPDAGPAAWSFGCGSPTPPFNDRKRPDLPGSWRTLVCLRPALGPRQDRRTRPYGAPTRPPPDTRRRLLQAMTFEAQSHGLGTGCLRFAGRVAPPPRQTRFPLPAKLYGVGLVTHRVRTKGFRDAPTSLSPFPGFAWRKRHFIHATTPIRGRHIKETEAVLQKSAIFRFSLALSPETAIIKATVSGRTA